MRWREPAVEPASPTADLARPVGAVRDSLVVGVWTLVSRISGFGRIAVIAAVLGPTFFGNTYQITNTLPNIIYYGLLAGSLVSSLLVPALVRHIDMGDRRSCERVAGGALGLILVALTPVIPIGLLVAPTLFRLATLGSAQSGVGAGQERLASWLLPMLLPQVFLYAVIGCSAAAMHAHRRFALPAAAPAIENLGSIVVLAITWVLYRDNASLDEVPIGELLLLGLGTTGAVAVHAAIQWLGAWRVGVLMRPRAGWRDDEVREILRRAVPSLIQAALLTIQLLAVLFVTNRVAGGVVAYQIAAAFFALPIALGATPVALSLLPRLSRLHQRGDGSVFRDVTARGLRFALFVTAPAAAVLAVLAPVLATAVSFGRMATDEGPAMVAAAVLVSAPGVVGETAFLVGTYASYSRNDTRSPLRSMVVKFVVCVALLGVASAAEGRNVVTLASLSVSVAAIAGAIHRLRTLLRGVPLGAERLLPACARTATAVALMIIPLYVGRLLLQDVHNQAGALGGAIVVCLISAGVYVGVQSLFHAPESSWMVGALAKRILPGARRARGSRDGAP